MLLIWTLKDKLLTYLIALTDPRTPVAGKVFAILSMVYLLSPVDIFLDTIPFAGFLDDLVLVPLGIRLSSKMIPPEVLQDAQKKAATYKGKLNLIAGIIVTLVLVWILVILGLVYLLLKTVFG